MRIPPDCDLFPLEKTDLAADMKGASDRTWYKDAVIYELHVRSFFDSNADGIGDFPGLTQKLDYLADLGVTALWLLPFYPSPLKDDGYDIADYYSINPMYGTLDDFKIFLEEAHKRGMRVITELVLNHTSDQHSWFQRARRAKPGSVERDYYVWSNDPQKYKEVRIIFKDFEPSNWTWDPIAHSYYWHRFFSHQPDLNFDNPKVHEEIFKVLDFWCDLGVDGFRLDAIPYLYEREGTSGESLPETHEFLRKLRRHVDEKYGDRMFLAEANQWPEESVVYFGKGKGDECHMAFHFPLMPRLFMSVRMEDRVPIVDILEQTPPIPSTSQWALFLRNHDELTLEMVTDEERDYMYRVYANESKARINLGIRRRLAPLLGNDRRKIELLNLLLFSLPGTPVVYYGDEIAMGDNIYLGDRNGVRTPMHWSSDKNAGFSRSSPQALPLPIIIDPEYHYESSNVEAQQRNSTSLLWWMKRLITLRKRYKAFGRGTLEFLHPQNRKVLAFIRSFEDETILVVANLSRFPQPAQLDLSAFKGCAPVELFGRTEFPGVGESPYFLTLAPHAAYWFSVQQKAVQVEAPPALPTLMTLSVRADWEEVLQGRAAQQLEAVLPQWLKTRPWFFGKDKDISAVRIEGSIPITRDDDKTLLAILDVEYLHAEAERYLLPLTIRAEGSSHELNGEFAHYAVAEVNDATGKRLGVIYDGSANNNFGQSLLGLVAAKRTASGAGGELTGAALRRIADKSPISQRSSKEQRNSAYIFPEKFFLKVFRRLEPGTNPELEVSRVLAAKNFQHVPAVVGSLEFRRDRDVFTVGMVSEIVPGARSAWEFTVDAVGRYLERVRAFNGEAHVNPSPQQSLIAMANQELPAKVAEIVGTYLEPARLLGIRTAELHVALASELDSPDFAPEPFTPFYLRSMYQSMRNQMTESLSLLQTRLPTLATEARVAAEQLLPLKNQMLQQLRAVFEAQPTGMRIRCHGNYHLAEVLYTGKDFVVIDFEGDPSRSIGERRIKRSVMHDTTRMIRSFDYAVHAALRQQMERGNISESDLPRIEPWLGFWKQWVSATFLKAYLGVTQQTDLLPRDGYPLAVLIYANLLDKAIHGIGNELANRPERAGIPIQAALEIFEMWKADETVSPAANARQTPRHTDVVH